MPNCFQGHSSINMLCERPPSANGLIFEDISICKFVGRVLLVYIIIIKCNIYPPYVFFFSKVLN